MGSAPGFVSELVRAANEVEKLTAFEQKRLLERAVYTIRDMRAQIGVADRKKASGAVIDLQTTAAALGSGLRTTEEIRSSLLKAAELIRTLYILVGIKNELDIKPRS